MEPSIDECGLEMIIRKIEKHGFDCRQLRPSYLQRRLLIRMHATRSRNCLEYWRLLNKDPEEYSRLLDKLTVNLTEFFRDTEVFKFIANNLAPELISRKVKHKQSLIRAWNAGCATGEEAYSIAMILHRAIAHRSERLTISVTGTDLDQNAIAHAKLGRYEQRCLKQCSSEIVERYLKRYLIDYGDYLEVSPVIKSLVKFKQLDLFAEEPIKMVDIIFCRNVMIYFSKSQQERLQSVLCNSLLKNGYLILGNSERLVGEAVTLLEPVNMLLRIYQRSQERILREGEGNEEPI
ncbi:MAG: protein-glutamate O-methyltransferase CheR [Actinobacteria bacterium]|nr:protein-glutamate O-methyltransferase CheR [Actinomycetota bacterium]